MRVSIITSTTGTDYLAECIESVRAQTYRDIEHIVVVDGVERAEKANSVLSSISFPRNTTEHVCVLPYATGIDGYNGHRIYGAATFFANGDYHIWLDEDNLLEPNHVQDLVSLVQEKNLDWAFSLRKIINSAGRFICYDDCESLGLWSSVLNSNDFFVDVNCYFVKKTISVGISPIWYRKFRTPGQVEIDRAIASVLMAKQNNLKFDTTREYTLKYRAGSTSVSVQADFFLRGNQKMLERYSGKLPWKNNGR